MRQTLNADKNSRHGCGVSGIAAVVFGRPVVAELFCVLSGIVNKPQQELAEKGAKPFVGFCRGVYAVGAQFLEVVFVYPAFCPEVQHGHGKAFGAFYLRVHVVAHPAGRVVFAQACAAVTV